MEGEREMASTPSSRAHWQWAIAAGLAGVVLSVACGDADTPAPSAESAAPAAADALDRDALRQQAQAFLGRLPRKAASAANPPSPVKIELGRMLYHEERLSKNHDISCNTCHLLDRHGVDGQPTSTGHREQRGDRNAPTVYNAALHIAQFWDGRAADVEEQAKGPILNPVEMAMPSEEAVLATLESIPGYAPLFAAAFPEDEQPITYDNLARAIGAFERELLTPSPFDAFLAGDDAAMTDAQVAGLDTFLTSGCVVCHGGPVLGGGMYRKLGLVKPYPTEDPGRQAVTGDAADLHAFKVPSLRNVAGTGPYLHDGSIESLDEVIRIMATHQLGSELSASQVASIRGFLEALTGEVDERLIGRPELPPSGPSTPKPDPS
jgi:cytochrome c peroxidase